MISNILIADGATGTYLANELNNSENVQLTDLLNINNPELVKKAHDNYYRAGTNIIKTNTFNSQYVSLNKYSFGNKFEEINRLAAKFATDCRDKWNALTPNIVRYVAGNIGATDFCVDKAKAEKLKLNYISPSGYEGSCFKQAEILISAKVDFIWLETFFISENTEIALNAAKNAFEKLNTEPKIIITFSVNQAGNALIDNTSLENVAEILKKFPIMACGVNCNYVYSTLNNFLTNMSALVDIPLVISPSAGIIGEDGNFSMSAKQIAEMLFEFSKNYNVKIVGSCCGSTPEYTKAIADLLKCV
ncbi:MAG: homocysteine S-methyltransferase family protein [Bacteroidales bacterium]